MKEILSKNRAWIAAAAVLLLLLALGSRWFHHGGAPQVPLAEVKKGEFVDYVQFRGELKALHSVQLGAPSISGDLQIVKLARNGSVLKAGDVVVQFDTTTLQNTLAQKESELKSAEADIEHSRAEGNLTQQQQATDLLQARFDVERAKLDARQQEILSEIDGAKNRLKLADAEQKYKELQQKDKSTKASGEAELIGKKQKRDKSAFDVEVTEKQIASLTLRAPADGMITILPNFNARSSNGATPDFKEGDRAWPGAVIAELPDLKIVRAGGRVDESDRGRLREGQTATIHIDAIPAKEFRATVAEISPVAKLDYSSWPFTKNFDISIQLLENDPTIRPGMSATARIAVDKVADGIVIPAEAVFEKDGGLVAYVLHGTDFETQSLQVLRRNKTSALIGNGLQPGDRVALKNPAGEIR